MDIGNENYKMTFREFVFKIRYWLILAFVLTAYFLIKDAITRREIMVYDVDGNYVYTIKTNKGKTIWDAPEVEVPEGYTIIWYNNPSFVDGRIGFPYEVQDDGGFYPMLKGNFYAMVFDPQNGDNTIRIVRRIGVEVPIPEDPVKEGYIFAGWYQEGVPIEYEITTMPLDGVSLYAKWIKIIED